MLLVPCVTFFFKLISIFYQLFLDSKKLRAAKWLGKKTLPAFPSLEKLKRQKQGTKLFIRTNTISDHLTKDTPALFNAFSSIWKCSLSV